MSHLIDRALPWLAAYLATVALATGLYLLLGAELWSAFVGGVVSGLLGLFGTLVFELVRVLQVRHADAIISEAYTSAPRDEVPVTELHEGLRRMYEDIWQDEEAVGPLENYSKWRRYRAERDDEPPER